MTAYPTRRSFLVSAGLAFPLLIPRRVFGANDRVTIGVIGMGNRANLLIDQLPAPGAVAALADCYLQRCHEAVVKRTAKWDVYQDYRRILDRKDIDAVIVATTDHGRVLPCIHACQAGKDVYAEKPLTLSIGEGRALVKAVRKYRRVFQVGTQQRSMEMNQNACRLVRTGGLGRITVVHGVNYPSSKAMAELAEKPVPETLNWDMWLGQAPMRPYCEELRTGWMGWYDYSGGEMTNWGCHGLDQIQCALGMDTSGPVELWPLEGGPESAVAFRYRNGVTVQLDLPMGDMAGGARFVGEEGTIDIWRNNFKIHAPGVTLDLPPAEEVAKWHDSRALWQARYHMQTWLDCIPSRRKPNADVEIGHRTASLAHLANITRRLNRKLRWDPKKERFPHDREAQALVNRPRRAGYELPKI